MLLVGTWAIGSQRKPLHLSLQSPFWETQPDWSNCSPIKAKFHQAILLANQLASWSATCQRPGHRPAVNRSAARFELCRHVDITRTWSQTGSNLVCYLFSDLLAHCYRARQCVIGQIPPRYRSATRSLAGCRSARKLVRQQDSLIEFGLEQMVEVVDRVEVVYCLHCSDQQEMKCVCAGEFQRGTQEASGRNVHCSFLR